MFAGNTLAKSRLLLALLAIALLFTVSSLALAGHLEDGNAASDRHDYATALQLWRPLADQGDAEAETDVA
jgi:hypothetical protein